MGKAPQVILDLVARFARNVESYREPGYNEAQARTEFIDPMFEALGWDMMNRAGHAEAYKDVIHEDAIKVGGATKAPDYCFRIGKDRKFFVEAKKPSVGIVYNSEAAYQLRRYGWSSKLPLSILTDFEEFAVYDCRVPPHRGDKASVARIFYVKFSDYAAEWEKIADVFSKEAVLKGSFDKYAEATRGKRGTSEVDAEFLREIEKWREKLARNFSLRNPSITVAQLNTAVQTTIDRIIFLRMCEDRGIEQEGRLQSLVSGERTYRRLIEVFYGADERYNSGLFHFRQERGRPSSPDELTPELQLDDDVLHEILNGLYYPRCPYEFSVVPTEILGNVYEQFLGKVIRLTTGHNARVEEKPEVRKAGGVYYTPQYIVDYIVQNTVGKLCAGKGPKDIERIRVLDPACGSGSFLLGAYNFLTAFHRDWYVSNGPDNHAARVYQGRGGQWFLTTAEKKRILLNNIYGADIDPQAVEVTKLSLLLKVLEEESSETLAHTLRSRHERALPDLDGNIKCGNSLIGPDFYEGKDPKGFSEDERRRINAFDWPTEFPVLFQTAKRPKEEAGFDAVIGNPPYVRIQGYSPNQVEYMRDHYFAATGNFDVYVVFAEKGFSLLRSGGRLGFILPNKFFRTDYGEGLRKLLSGGNAIRAIVDFQERQVFPATTYTCLLFLQRSEARAFQYARAAASADALAHLQFEMRRARELSERSWTLWQHSETRLYERIAEQSVTLLQLPAEMSRGSSTGNDEVFLFNRGSLDVEPGIVRRPLFAGDFGRYRFDGAEKWGVIFPYVMEAGRYRLYTERELRIKFPKAYRHLKNNEATLRGRKQFKEWFGFSAPRNLELHDRAQIAVPLLADHGMFSIIPRSRRMKWCPMASGGFTITLPESIKARPEYILGLLNSKLLFWFLRNTSNVFRGGWVTCTKQYFGQLPIRRITLADKAAKAKHDQMVKLVDRVLELHKRLPKAKAADEKRLLGREIQQADDQIDRLVYELYDLTEDEIKTVEKAGEA